MLRSKRAATLVCQECDACGLAAGAGGMGPASSRARPLATSAPALPSGRPPGGETANSTPAAYRRRQCTPLPALGRTPGTPRTVTMMHGTKPSPTAQPTAESATEPAPEPTTARDGEVHRTDRKVDRKKRRRRHRSRRESPTRTRSRRPSRRQSRHESARRGPKTSDTSHTNVAQPDPSWPFSARRPSRRPSRRLSRRPSRR